MLDKGFVQCGTSFRISRRWEGLELFRQLQALPIDQKRRLLLGLVDGDIIVKPLTPDAVLEIEEGPNALNKWVKINWKYNPAIIQAILGVKIVSEVSTTEEPSAIRKNREAAKKNY